MRPKLNFGDLSCNTFSGEYVPGAVIIDELVEFLTRKLSLRVTVPGVSLRIFTSGLIPNENFGVLSNTTFSGL